MSDCRIQRRACWVAFACLTGAVAYTSGCGHAAEPPDPVPANPVAFDPVEPASTQKEAPVRLSFEDITASSGVVFKHDPTRTQDKHMPEIMGSGVGVADFNGDGAPDVLLVNGGNWLTGDRGGQARNRLYLNDGHAQFTDVSDAWHVPSLGYGMGIAVGDYDNDGLPDVYFTGMKGAQALLRNTGSGFVDVTDQVGLPRDTGWSTSAGFFDLEGDGDLDLYVAHYVRYTSDTKITCVRGGLRTYCTPLLFDGERDHLYRNDGAAGFVDISDQAGVPDVACNGLAVGIADVNGDDLPDVYVANDQSRNFLLINQGDGTLVDVAREAGVAYSEQGVEESSMGVDFSDVDADGRDDIVITNLQGQTTSVYMQGQDLYFRESSDRIGVGRTARARLSFGVDFCDLDNDTDDDLLVANGHIEDVVEAYSQTVMFAQPNQVYECTGPASFRDVTEQVGGPFLTRAVSRGLASADFDADGRIDFIVSNNSGTPQVVRNTTPDVGHFVNLWLVGTTSNRSAYGAKVSAAVGGRTFHRQVHGATSYLSVADSRLHFGLGSAQGVDELTIRWPSGTTQTIRNVEADHFYRIVEGADPVTYTPGQYAAP